MQIIEKLPFDEYCALEGYINNSALKLINQSPAHYKASLEEPMEESSALLIGHASHTAILEPELFQSSYSVFPDNLTKQTKDGKNEWARLEALGLPILRFSEWEAAVKLSAAVKYHPTASELLQGKKELTILSELQQTKVKARLDCLIDGIIVDVKTTEDASPEAFSRTIYNYEYHQQAAFYLDAANACGLEVGQFIFIAVEKKPPYAIGIYQLDADAITEGRALYRKALKAYETAEAFDYWPGYSTLIQAISLPHWVRRINHD